MKKIITLFIIVLCLTGFKNEPVADFIITIDRKSSTKNCTMGYMFVDGTPIAYTLELPWKDNKNDISCITVGDYEGILRYDHNDKWRVELKDVPNRTNVQIHIGNITDDTKGCVLIGLKAQIEDCKVNNSAQAYAKLKELFYGIDKPTSTPNKNIRVIFK